MTRAGRLVALSICMAVVAALCASASSYRVLLVDGTKTLQGTLRVGVLAGGIRQSGLADVTALFTDVSSPFDDPLAGKQPPSTPYDFIIIVPRGVEDGTANVVWVLVAGSPTVDPEVPTALAALGGGMSLLFGEGVRAQGPLDDLWATLTSALYVAEGWLR